MPTEGENRVNAAKFGTKVFCRRFRCLSPTPSWHIVRDSAGERARQTEIASYAAMQFRQKPAASPSPPVEVTAGPANHYLQTRGRRNVGKMQGRDPLSTHFALYNAFLNFA